jgi:hypothetical protein
MILQSAGGGRSILMGRVRAADPVIKIDWNYGRGFFKEPVVFF